MRRKRIDLFTFGINYNDPQYGGTPLYNGNISETEWRTDNTDNNLKHYVYEFDPLNRLIGARDNIGNYNLGVYDGLGNLTGPVAYDRNGNVTGLTRKGHLDIGGTSFGNMDVLGYVYDSGNKVLRIDDSGSDAQGFRDGTNVNDDFEYDANGNLKVDRNKGITSITYNHLNMPTSVSFDSGGVINYVYDASGTKLEKTASNGTYTEYAGNYIYENGTLQFFRHPEGYTMPDNGDWRYVYQYKDHVDNIRLSYTDNNGTLEIIEENNYYPFGGKMRGYNSNVSSFGNSTAQRWKFGGMELDESLDGAMGTYDFGARIYDEWGVRWWNIDPKAEQMRRHSPYNYAFNNPVYFIDPDGMAPYDCCGPRGVLDHTVTFTVGLINVGRAFLDLPPINIEGDATDDWVSGDRSHTSEEDKITVVVSDSRGDNNDTTDAPTTFIDGDAIGQAGGYARSGKDLSKRSKGPSKTGPENKSMARDVAETGKKTKSGLETGNNAAGTITAANQKDGQQVDTVEYNVTMWKNGQPQGGGGDYGKKNAEKLKKQFLDGEIFPDLELDSVSVKKAHNQ